jgi:hypothetical protein
VRSRRLATLLAVVVLAQASLAAVAPASAAGVGPPLPAQPGLGTRPPTCAPSKASKVLSADKAVAMSYRADASALCVLYRAPDTQTLERSDDGGLTWQQVFKDQARGACQGSTCAGGVFAASSLVALPGRSVLMSEAGSGDAIVASADLGTTWDLRNGGTGGLDGKAVISVTTAPGDPKVMYAMLAPTSSGQVGSLPSPAPQNKNSGAAFHLYVTHDGGGTWTPTAVSLADTDPAHSPVLAVDPADAGHFWAAIPGLVPVPGSNLAQQQGALYDVTGFGSTVAAETPIPAAADFVPSGLTVITSQRHSRRLVLLMASGGAFNAGPTSSPHLWYSDNDGRVSWAAAPGPYDLDGLGVAIDPSNPDRALYAGWVRSGSVTRMEVSYTEDGFDTAGSIQLPISGMPQTKPASPLYEGGVLQATSRGEFYLHAGLQCGASITPSCLPTGAPMQVLVYVEPYFTSVPYGGSGAFSTGGGFGGPGVPARPLTEVRVCHFPRPASGYSSLTFDGENLLYTEGDETGPTPGVGVVRKLNAARCADAGQLQIRISPDDAKRVMSCDQQLSPADAQAKAKAPNIDDLAYDSARNRLWFNLGTSTPNPQGGGYYTGSWNGSCVLSSPIVGGALSATVPPWTKGCGGGTLTYDLFDDALWTCGGPEIGLPTGRALSGCSPTGSTSTIYGSVSTWAVGGPNRLYVQEEDDATVTGYDTASCVALIQFSHRGFSEARAEEEQMVCDPVTFGPKNAPVLWIRDDAPSTVSAYRLNDGYCPFSTNARLAAPSTAALGQIARLCARVATRGMGITYPDLPVEFIADGASPPLGIASTSPGGTACIDYPVALAPGKHKITALFAGVRGLFGSLDNGILDVSGPVPPPTGPTAVGALLILTPPVAHPAVPPNPNPVNAPANAPAPAPQAQPVTQGQPVPQAGLSAERQQEPQLALATNPEAMEQALAGDYNIVAAPSFGPAQLGTALALGVGVVMLLGWAAYTLAPVRQRLQRAGRRRR